MRAEVVFISSFSRLTGVPSKQNTTLIAISQDDSITMENALQLFGNIDERFIDFKMDRMDMLTLFLALESKFLSPNFVTKIFPVSVTVSPRVYFSI